MAPLSRPRRSGRTLCSSNFGEAMKPVVKIVAALTVLCGFAAGTKSVAAHHAMVMYDRSTTVTLDGTVVELQWTNPVPPGQRQDRRG
jgi:hypothetical protein